MTASNLARVRRAAARRAQVDAEWKRAIRDARANGATLREIGEAAGVSHPRIVQLLRDSR